MQGMCLCLVYHVCNTILTYCWLPSVFFRWFAHGLVKPIGNSTKWTQSAVKRKAFEHGAKSMVTESAIRVIEIARCLFSKQTKTAGPQWTTLPCFDQQNWWIFAAKIAISWGLSTKTWGWSNQIGSGTLEPNIVNWPSNKTWMSSSNIYGKTTGDLLLSKNCLATFTRKNDGFCPPKMQYVQQTGMELMVKLC